MKLFLSPSHPCPHLLYRGSAVAKIIGCNVKKLQKFASTVRMWVFEENIDGRKLTDIINNDHENVKYLPGYKLPENVVSLWMYSLGPGSKEQGNQFCTSKALGLFFSPITAWKTYC